MDSAFIHQAANELVQNAGTRNIKQIAAVVVWTSAKHPALKICWVYFRSILISH